MRAVVSALVFLAMLGLGRAADAGGTTVIIISGGVAGRHSLSGVSSQTTTAPHTRIIIRPGTVYVPVYVQPVHAHWRPGYWTYQWVPRLSSSRVWIPGRYAAAGASVDPYWEPRWVETGYYQPVWVEGYWAP